MNVDQLSKVEAAVGAESAARQETRSDINRLEDENASLRAYLDRVLAMLGTELTEPEPVPASPAAAAPIPEPVSIPEHVLAPAPVPEPSPHSQSPSKLLRLADVERRLKRTEETLEDLVWLVARLEQEAAAKYGA